MNGHTTPHHVLFLFIDGIGLGPHTGSNPLATLGTHWAHLGQQSAWTSDIPVINQPHHVFRPVDATLNIAGLPQSGTGQATLFSGVNCAERAGRHFGPFPHSSSKPILATHNLFQRVKPALPAADCAFANAYPPIFFESRAKRDRWTVTTLCSKKAGVRLRSTEDLRRGEALSADLVGTAWPEKLGIKIPQLSSAQAGAQLYRIMQQHRLTLFEYYETDKAGHGRSSLSISTILNRLDALLGALLNAFAPATDLLLICSDHGNLEAPNQKPHTRNPVPLVAYGCGAGAFSTATSLTDVTPILAALLQPDVKDSACTQPR